MMTDAPLRATDTGVEKANQFKPGADPDAWIDQMAGPYQERPWSVIRELFQNASDAITSASDLPTQMIEFALLRTTTSFTSNHYNFVIRDSGPGMSDEEFCAQVGILGNSLRRGDPNTIGQFGVGFYSTHAICHEVTFISKKQGADEVIGWSYAPIQKTFFRIGEPAMKELLENDFDHHPDSSRRRTHGSSVYFSIDFETHPLCEEWLVPENLLRKVKRDFFIIPAPIYLADYSKGQAAPILDINGNDVSSQQQNLDIAPWELEKREASEATKRLLRSQLPYTRDDDLPTEHGTFSASIGQGTVSGLLFASHGTSDGVLSLCHKHMWVETAKDCKPAVCLPVNGVVNIDPDDSVCDVKVTPSRDHLIRDACFQRVRIAVEDACINFLADQGESLVQAIQQAAAQSDSLESTVSRASKLVNSSAFFSILTNTEVSYHALLRDIPIEFREIIQADSCPAGVIDSVKAFVDSCFSKHVTLNDLPHVLEALQANADKEAEREKVATDRQIQYWNPRATRLFLRLVGRFIPMTLAIRERRKDGGFNVRTLAVPIASISAFDPAAAKGVDILLKGTAEEYLSEYRDKGSVLLAFYPGQPKRETPYMVGLLALIDKLSEQRLPRLSFVEIKKEQFQEIKTRENWELVIACFDRIINAGHHAGGGGKPIEVDALGYQGESIIPLLFDTEGDKTTLVINAYNALMKDVMAAFTDAAQRNDDSSKNLLYSICHELYHHALHVDAVYESADGHALATRNEVFSEVVAMLQKYNDLRG